MKSHRLIAASAAAALTFGGIVGGGIVLAQDPGTTPTPSTKEERSAEKQAQFDAYITELAGNLGIDAQTLKDAIKKTNLSFIDKAVADGKLTAEQAQELKDRIEAGNFTTFGIGGFGAGGHGGGHKGGGEDHGGPFEMGMGLISPADHEAIAGFFGMTLEELLGELKDGKSLAAIAGENAKSADDLKNFITSELDKKLQEQVTAGRITQEQADKMKSGLTENLDAIINGTLPLGGLKGMDGPKGMKGPRGMAPDEMPAPGSAAPGFRGSRSSSAPSPTLD